MSSEPVAPADPVTMLLQRWRAYAHVVAATPRQAERCRTKVECANELSAALAAALAPKDELVAELNISQSSVTASGTKGGGAGGDIGPGVARFVTYNPAAALAPKPQKPEKE